MSAVSAADAAASLADALDLGAFAAAGRLLAPDCRLDGPRASLAGRDAIVAAWEADAAWSRRALDDVRHESSLVEASATTATILRTDYLVKAGGSFHRRRAWLDVAVGPGGITRLVMRDPPGSAEALEAFYRACNVVPPRAAGP